MKIDTRCLLALVLGGAATGSAFADIKTDGLWRGSGGAALSATSGNTSTSALLLNADALRATSTDKITLGGSVNYGRSKDAAGVSQTTSNRWGAFGQYDYNLSPQLFVFGRLGLEADKLIDLSLRSSLATGLGYKVIDAKETTLELFGGLGYTSDKYSLAQTIGNRTATRFSRASVYLGEASTHQLTPTVAFKQRLDLYPGISGDKAVLARFSAGLAVAMSSTLNLNVGLTDNYNSKPPAGAKKNDAGIFTGINVKFGAS